MRREILTNVIYPKIELNSDSLYAALLMTGYLKPVLWEEKEDYDAEESDYECTLQIPNKEVRTVYRNEILSFIDDLHGLSVRRDIGQAIRTNDV